MRYRDSKGKAYTDVFQALLGDAKKEVEDFKATYLPGMDTVMKMNDLQRFNGAMPADYEARENLLADIIRACEDIMIDYETSTVLLLDHERKPMASVRIDMTEFKEKIDGFIIDAFSSEKSNILYVPKCE